MPSLPSEISPREAAKALLMRRRARSSVLDFARAIQIPGKPATDDPDSEFFEPVETTMAEHHRLILTTLDRISKTPHGRLMILMPPGSAKSTYASVVFPTFYLGKYPQKRIILASYGDDLASKLGRRSRSILLQKRYQRVMETQLSMDSAAVQNFMLTNGSEYMSCGIMSGITGNRADGIIIDDPIKGREQADSKIVRDKTKAAYEDDLKTRLRPGGWICLIQTRWHEDDLAGSILPENWRGESGELLCRDGQVWEILCIQAKCETETDPLGRQIGEYLWPEWFTSQHWAQFEWVRRTWTALYQQIPSQLEGTLFKRSWWQYYSGVLPVFLTIFQVWDTGVKEKKENDPSACLTLGLHKIGWYLLDAWSERVEYPDLDAAARLQFAKWKDRGCSQVLIEDASSGSSLIQTLKRGTNIPVKAVRHQNKLQPAYAISPYVEAGRIFLPIDAPWTAAFVDQFADFPLASHDEYVDCLSFAIQKGPTVDMAKSAPPRSPVSYVPESQGSRRKRAKSDDDDIHWKGGRR